MLIFHQYLWSYFLSC